MHQTFYIDTDEEISSVIDRLRKSVAVENHFVVPKRALFLQSVVNLKLLKREAEKIKKHIVLITQDEIGISMAQKAGIETMDAPQDIAQEFSPIVQEEDSSDEQVEEFHEEIEEKKNRKKRLDMVGTNEFYDAAPMDLVSRNSQKISALRQRKNVLSAKRISEKRHVPKIHKEIFSKPSVKPSLENKNYAQNLDPQKEQALEKIFSSSEKKNEKEKNQQIRVGKKSKK